MGGWQRVDGEVVIRRGQDGQKDGMVGETLGLQLDGLTPARKQQTQSWREQRLVFSGGRRCWLADTSDTRWEAAYSAVLYIYIHACCVSWARLMAMLSHGGIIIAAILWTARIAAIVVLVTRRVANCFACCVLARRR